MVWGGVALSGNPEPHECLTFLIRLWQEEDAGGQSHWRGRVEHVAAQEVVYVEDVAGVARFIECWTMGDEEDEG